MISWKTPITRLSSVCTVLSLWTGTSEVDQHPHVPRPPRLASIIDVRILLSRGFRSLDSDREIGPLRLSEQACDLRVDNPLVRIVGPGTDSEIDKPWVKNGL